MMAESSEVQALEKISTEVGESQIKITLSSQCIKAQAFLVDKLRKQTERQKEICSFISSNNLKLQTEIKQAELEIKSLIIAYETIKSGNIELKKEFLLAKEKKSEIAERISNGEKKYEALWLESKERYEGLPYVQKLLQATAEAQILKEKIVELGNQSCLLLKEYKIKKDYYTQLDRNRILELADYFINILPKAVKALDEKNIAINKITTEIDKIVNDQAEVVKKQSNISPKKQTDPISEETKSLQLDDGWLNIAANNESNTIMMPRLQFKNSDFDVLNAKLDQIKIMKVEILNTNTSKRLNPMENIPDLSSKRMKDDEFSIFFHKPTSIEDKNDKANKDGTYSNRKLINILEDVKLDTSDAFNMVAKVNLDNLKGVNSIGEVNTKDIEVGKDQKDTEEIEEIDLTKSNSEKNNCSLLIPPTQFLDLSQEISGKSQQVEVIVHMSMTEPSSGKLSQSLKNSQENINKKKVSFDLPLSIQEITTKTNEVECELTNIDSSKANETMDSQLDVSLVSNDSYSKIKDMILKQHNLDLSPQFTYAKNRMLPLNSDDKVITSRFFQSDKTKVIDEDDNNISLIAHISKEHEDHQNASNKEETENINEVVMDVDQMIVSSPKASQKMTDRPTERPVTGLLFNHGTQGIPDSLNVSISTTGFEEGDADFPHCIDSSLLLSPKADIPMPMSGDNIDVTSQEVPNFLSGLRKTGLSFFGQSATSESKPDTSNQNQGSNFNFNFGGGEQKSRGGLFSMFR